MRIQTNVSAINSCRQVGANSARQAKTTEKLSSGYRVNRSADDAAGLAISEKLRTQIRGLSRASLNTQDGISLVQVGDGALQIITEMAQRIRELSVQAANDTNDVIDRQAIQKEISQLTSEVNQVIRTAEFNGKPLFDGSIGASWEYHLGLITQAMDRNPAVITAGNPFQPMSISAWTLPATFGISGNTHLNALNLPTPTFPLEGIFAIQVQTPAHGNLNVVLDFAELNQAGNFNLDDFVSFIEDAFEDFQTRLGLSDPIIDGVNIGASGQIELVFPRDSTGHPTGIMAMSGSQPRVHIGVGAAAGWVGSTSLSQTTQINSLNTGMRYPAGIPNIPTNAVFANSAIFGATGGSSSVSHAFRVTSGTTTITPAQLTAINTDPVNSTLLWDLVPDTTVFSWQLEEWTHNPAWGSSASSGNYTFSQTLYTRTMTKAELINASGATTFAQANNWLSSQGDGVHLSNLSLGTPSVFVNRGGLAYINFSPSATRHFNDPALIHRYRVAASPSTGFVSNTSVQSALPSVTSVFPARPSEETGLLTINISGVPTSATASTTVSLTIDFSESRWTDASTRQDLIDYINENLNPPNTVAPWNPVTYHPNTTYSTANPTRPVATASVNSAGNLVITAAERSFSVSVNEMQSDRPMFANFAQAQVATATPSTMTINVSGFPHTVTLVPGDFTDGPGGIPSGIDKFVNANRAAFAAAGFNLSREGGNLVIATIQGGDHITVGPSSITTSPAVLINALGFGGTNIYENGTIEPATETDALWIQSGANRGQGLNIEIPRLCVRSLGLAMWRPYDESLPWVGFAALGASNYTTAANVEPALSLDPPGYSLDVSTHINATHAISVVSNAINILSTERARLGAQQNRLEFTKANADNTNENMAAAESRIRDADMAKEMTEFTKHQILVQASTAVLAQANALPQAVLQLLG